MAEWSKALVLGTSLFGGAGSNPASVTFGAFVVPFRGGRSAGFRTLANERGISSIGRVRRSQRRGTGIETRILHFQTVSTVGLVGYDARLTRERSPVRSRAGVFFCRHISHETVSPWRNGSALDSRPKGWGFESLFGHTPGGSSVGRAVDCKARRAAIHWSAVQICLPGVAFPFFFFSLRRWLAPVHRARPGLPSYGHITAKTPDPIRTPKLSAVEPDQYYGGGPRGNLGCRMAAMHRLQSSAGRASGC